MTVSLKLEHVIEEVISEDPKSQQRALRKLAGVKLSTQEAGDAWPRIIEHKWYLGERLGRDVGLRVAAIDYFENVRPPRPRVSSWTESDALPPRLPMMMGLGERP